MKKPLHYLVLIGFISQGFAWNGYLLVCINVALWCACGQLQGRLRRPPPAWIEILALPAGALIGFFASRLFDQSAHFTIGHGVTAIQAVRLLRPLSLREQRISFALACLQIGVACTTLFDFRFLLILAAALLLVPRTLITLATAGFSQPAPPPRLGLAPSFCIGAIMLLFFLTFPRGFVPTPFQSAGAQATGGALDAILDPSRSSGWQSGRVIMQVEGENIGYLRAASLVLFDGQTWQPLRNTPLRHLNWAPPEQLPDLPYRRVRVKDPVAVAGSLPIDGHAAAVRGSFFQRPMQDPSRIVEVPSRWQSRESTYEYWLHTNDIPEHLSSSYQNLLLQHPPLSPRLNQWLQELLPPETDPMKKAVWLERYFQTNFTYRLGAPRLDRLQPIEDFIFNQREGHCERFAAALTLLLRSQGIPARVMIGYLPSSRSWLSGAYNIRFRDAHAWTEAYFPEHGWLTLDATPRATGQYATTALQDLIELFEITWYVHVVNFDRNAQTAFWTDAGTAFKTGLGSLLQHRNLLAAIPALAAAAFLIRNLRTRPSTHARAISASSSLSANPYYQRMLDLLSRDGLPRRPDQTPAEYIDSLAASGFPKLHAARQITEVFCATRYGRRPLTQPDITRLEANLADLARQC